MGTAPETDGPARLPPETSPRVPVVETLPLEQLVTDAGTQVRSEISQETVDAYAEALARGERFPPVVVFRSKGSPLVLADGFHRVRAFRQAGRVEISADVYDGGVEDAVWYALGANRTHGERLSSSDKRRAIEIAYRSWPDLSQGRIAAQVGCTQAYVGRIRDQLNTSIELPDRVVGKDGRRRPAKRPTPRRSALASSSADAPDPSGPTPSSAARPAAGKTPDVTSREYEDPPENDAVAGDRLAKAATTGGAAAAAPSETSDPSSSSSADESSATLPTSSKSARLRSNRIVSVVADKALYLTAEEDLIDFAVLDRAQLPKWIEDIEQARLLLGRFLRRLREEVDHGARSDSVSD